MKIIRGILYLSAALLLYSGNTDAQSAYDISSLNPELIKNAKAIIRSSETILEINASTSASLKVRIVVTVMNEKGRYLSVYHGVDDRFVTYRFNNLVIYDKTGAKVKDFGTQHLQPLLTFLGGNLYQDVFYKTLDPEFRTYPFTAEIIYNVDFKSTFHLPDWMVAGDKNVSVEKATMVISAPKDFIINYYEQNLPESCIIENQKEKKVYKWNVENLKAMEEELFSLPADRMSPAVYISPASFEVAGRKGNSETWNDLGFFLKNLNDGRNVLPENVKAKVKEITSATPDTIEVIRKLYAFMQETTRYVSVQIGIGGWQPIEAMKVGTNSYGDCKALSNYMKSLLDCAGIRSHYTVIYAGDDAMDIFKEFPSNQFNHAVLCVPFKPDTIWLECTSQRIPFSYIGSFTDDRHALLVTEKGGRLGHTKVYSADENCMTRKARVTIDPAGNGKASVTTRYSSYFYDEMAPVLLSDYEDQKRIITESITIPGFNLVNFKINQPDKKLPEIIEELDINLKGYAITMTDRLILPLNLMNKGERLPASKIRTSDILQRRDKSMIDTIVYTIPQGYTVSSSLVPVNYNTPYGSYNVDIQTSGADLIFIRRQIVKKGVFPSSDYSVFAEYINKIAAADLVKVVLKKTQP